MVPHCAEGGNSLLLMAISSQNKNISFRRKSQINTGFYLTKKCFFLTHFMCWMKDVSKHWVKWVSGMHTHTSNFTPSLVFPSFSLFVSHNATHLCTYTKHTHPEAFVFHTFLASKGTQSLTVDSGRACLTSPHCCVKFSHQWRVYLVW